MTTLSELVDSIASALHSYSGLQEQVTWLSTGCDASTTSLSVASTETVMRGIAEIDDELVYVNTSDSGTLTLAPFGRGFRGSTAAAHSANAMVTFDPAFPRVEIKRAINQCIEGLFPGLYQTKLTTVTYSVPAVGHALPADVEKVLSVKANLPSDAEDYWAPIHRWSFDTTDADGNVLNLYAPLTAGVSIQVVYAAKFGALTTDFATAGLPESYADLIMYCVTSRMMRFLEPSRITLGSAENVSRAQVVQSGDAGRTANQLYAMYQTRLAEERRKLLDLNPPDLHFLPR